MLYIEHYLQPTSSYVLEFLSSRCSTLFGETCGSQFKGQCMERMVCFMGYDMIKAHMGQHLLLENVYKAHFVSLT